MQNFINSSKKQFCSDIAEINREKYFSSNNFDISPQEQSIYGSMKFCNDPIGIEKCEFIHIWFNSDLVYVKEKNKQEIFRINKNIITRDEIINPRIIYAINGKVYLLQNKATFKWRNDDSICYLAFFPNEDPCFLIFPQRDYLF